MKRYLVVCLYDGTDFCGWQVQNNKRSVAGEITKALSAFHKKPIVIVGAGRTDQGVHAEGQAFHFDSNLDMTPKQYMKALKTYLPSDIQIASIKEVSNDFHARFSAKGKHYRYIINNGKYNIFNRNHEVYLPFKLDVALMQEAAKCFLGTHDFSSFCTTKYSEKEIQVRTIHSITIGEDRGIITFDYYGDSFLRHMIRMITETLVEVGKGKLSKEEVLIMLEAKTKGVCRYKAPACGLYLMRVIYEEN